MPNCQKFIAMYYVCVNLLMWIWVYVLNLIVILLIELCDSYIKLVIDLVVWLKQNIMICFCFFSENNRWYLKHWPRLHAFMIICTSDPTENCLLNVKKLPINWHFVKKNWHKLSFISTKLPLAILFKKIIFVIFFGNFLTFKWQFSGGSGMYGFQHCK